MTYNVNIFKHTVTLVGAASKCFYQVIRLVGNFSLEILFRLFNPFARREDFSLISYKRDVCGMSELNLYSL